MIAYLRTGDVVGHVVVVVTPSITQPDRFIVMDPAVRAFRAWSYGRFSGNYALFGVPR
jgi:hypothetical protein